MSVWTSFCTFARVGHEQAHPKITPSNTPSRWRSALTNCLNFQEMLNNAARRAALALAFGALIFGCGSVRSDELASFIALAPKAPHNAALFFGVRQSRIVCEELQCGSMVLRLQLSALSFGLRPDRFRRGFRFLSKWGE